MSKTRRQIARFIVAGVAGLVVDVGVLYLALLLGFDKYLGRALSFLAAVWVTWQFNRRITFAVGAPVGSLWREWWTYLAAMLGGGAVNYAAYAVFVHTASPHPLTPMLGVSIGSLAGMTVNFVSAKFLVFRR